jgi:integrase
VITSGPMTHARHSRRAGRAARGSGWHFDLLLYTGLRRGDAVRLGRLHVRNDVATIHTEKTGQRVTITILPPLLECIDADLSVNLQKGTNVAAVKVFPKVIHRRS